AMLRFLIKERRSAGTSKPSKDDSDEKSIKECWKTDDEDIKTKPTRVLRTITSFIYFGFTESQFGTMKQVESLQLLRPARPTKDPNPLTLVFSSEETREFLEAAGNRYGEFGKQHLRFKTENAAQGIGSY